MRNYNQMEKDYFDNLDNFYTSDDDLPQYSNNYQYEGVKSYQDYRVEEEEA